MVNHRENLRKSGNLTLVREIRKSLGNCGLLAVGYCCCDRHEIKTCVQLSKVDMLKMDCQPCHGDYSGVTRVCIPLVV